MDILIDFDGTVVTHEFPNVGQDIGAIPILKELVKHGHRLILFTMRSSDQVNLEQNGDCLTDAVNWFEQNKIPLYGIQHNPTQTKWTSSPKAYGQLIIDDTCLGIPMTYSTKHDRPYVDWKRVAVLLANMNLISTPF